MSATILSFPSAPSHKARFELNPEEIRSLGIEEIVRELADIVTDGHVPADAWHLLVELNDRLPELYEIFEEIYAEGSASGRLTAAMIDDVLKCAEPAMDQRNAYLDSQRELYGMAA